MLTNLALMLLVGGLLAIMSLNIVIKKKKTDVAQRLSRKFSSLWVVAEIILFVLVGASLNLKYTVSAGFSAAIVIMAVLSLRMVACLPKASSRKLLSK